MITSVLIVLNYMLVVVNLTNGASVLHRSAMIKSEDKQNCAPISEEVLSQILGASFNSRYMSINKPEDENTQQTSPQVIQIKRKAQSVPSFYVEDNYAQELGNAPAWDMTFTLEDSSDSADNRDKRGVSRTRGTASSQHYKREPWQCEKTIRWIDLGPDYFPRYLRSVECTKHTCFYGHYRCRPKSFVVRLMRRRTGVCVSSDPTRKLGIAGMPTELRELWIWEERAVNFCCECAA